MTVNGSLRITRRVWWSPESGAQRPVDGWLEIDDATVSRGARELCSLAAMAGGSFAKGVEVLERLGQLRVSDERLRVLAEAEGRRAREALDSGALEPGWTAAECAIQPGGPTRVLVGCGGVLVPVITAAEKAKRRDPSAAAWSRAAEAQRGHREGGGDGRGGMD